MAHLCRSLFPTILEEEGTLFNLLSQKFSYNKFLYDDLIENNKVNAFKNYIYSFVKSKEQGEEATKSPQELLDIAGYNLYECHSESDIQSFKKYYHQNEELCTFNGDRLNRCHVFFAVKKDVENIKRENFKHPKREDEYGTSVISIQFTRGESNILSIKNRYNHRVANPDATFSNDLDNIIPGLTKSFEKYYGFNMSAQYSYLDIPGYVKAVDGKYYKYNYEKNNIYYCPNNIIIDTFDVNKKYLDKSRYIVLDYFILDLQNKRLYKYDNHIKDSFVNGFHNIEKISITNLKEEKCKLINMIVDGYDVSIKLDKTNKIIEYKNNNIRKINDNFLYLNTSLENLEMNNVKEIGNLFLYYNDNLINLSLPKIEKIGDRALYFNSSLKNLTLPNLSKVGNKFLSGQSLRGNCNNIESLSLPNLTSVGYEFMANNYGLSIVDLPELRIIGNDFFGNNQTIKKINLPKASTIGDYFLSQNNLIKEIDLPSATVIGNSFFTNIWLGNNNALEKINLPKVEIIGNYFLNYNNTIKSLELPEVRMIGDNFLTNNGYEKNKKIQTQLEKIYMPKVEKIGDYFLSHNNSITEIDFPYLEQIGDCFLEYNQYLKNLNVPRLKYVGSFFLRDNENIKTYNLENLISVDNYFLPNNKSIKKLSVPYLEEVGSYFLFSNKRLNNFYAPRLTNKDAYFLYLNSMYSNSVIKNLVIYFDKVKELFGNKTKKRK